MKYVEFTDQDNKDIGRAILKNGKIEYDGLDQGIVNSIKSFGVIEVANGSMTQLFPDGPDPELFLKNLQFEFSGSAFRASKVREIRDEDD